MANWAKKTQEQEAPQETKKVWGKPVQEQEAPQETKKTWGKPAQKQEVPQETKKTWGKPAQKQETPKEAPPKEETGKVSLAYIDKGTRDVAQSMPIVDRLSKALLEKATEIMEKLDDAKLVTKSQTKDKSSTYTDKAVIKVEPAVKWNRETEEEEPLVHKDGTQVYKATAEIKHNGTNLCLIAKENISDGVKFAAMTASKWDRNNATPKLNFYKQSDIANAPINKDIKEIASFIEKNNFIEKREDKSSQLKDFSVQANQYFNANTDKVPNENGDLVNNAYAKYENGNYGEKVILKNHNDNVAVELGVTSKGDNYALAINYDLNKEFELRQDKEAPAKVYINNTEDLEGLVELPEIKDAITEFKGFSEKEANKEQPKEKGKNAVER